MNEDLALNISSDKQKAYVQINNSALPITKELLQKFLLSEKVVFGIIPENLDKIAESPNAQEEYLVAKGIAPLDGEDSKINFFFNTIPFLDREPLKRENDSVDHYNKGEIEYVEENEIIAECIKPTKGTPGANVYGETISPNEGKLITINTDATVDFSNQDLKFRSLIAGHPVFENNKLKIINPLVFQDIDLTTGNIVFKGNIVIKGNVRSGFDVTTDGDIDILGSIHHANVFAKGRIICKGGKIPGESGTISAGEDVEIAFIDGGEIRAGNNIIAKERIINTQASSKNSVVCNPNSGLILGGKIVTEQLIQTFDIGSPNETKTEIILDNVSDKLDRIKEIDVIQAQLKKELQDSLHNFNKLEKLLKTSDLIENINKKQMDKILNTYTFMENNRKNQKTKINELSKERIELLQQINNGKPPEIFIYGTIYPKVSITINKNTLIVKNMLTCIKISILNNDFQFRSLKPKDDEWQIEK